MFLSLPRITHSLATVTFASIGCVATLVAQQPRNLGFETADTRGLPIGWQVLAAGYQITVDSTAAFAGRLALRASWVDTASYLPTSNALIGEYMPAPSRGIRLRLSGYIRTQKVRVGSAQLFINVADPSGRSLASDAMQSRAPTGTTPWTRYEVEVPIDSGATAVTFGVRLKGDGTAWFDSLALETVGGTKFVDAETLTLGLRPPEDLTRLFTDRELAPPPDSLAPVENADYAAWVRSHAKPIRSLGSGDFADLRFLAPLLSGKRILQLGESGHGVAEFSMAKVRLIKYLHEELGYDVLAFESPFYECNRAQHDIALLTADKLMRSCINGVWHVDEVLGVTEYLKETQRTSHPLVLAGFDDQVTAVEMARGRPAFFRSLVELVDSSYAAQVYATDLAFVRNHAPWYVTANGAQLVAFYDSLAAFLDANARAIRAAFPTDSFEVAVARQAARSAAAEVRQLAAGSRDMRDSAMADNLEFLLNELHPGKKIIVWAHNAHVQHGATPITDGPTRGPGSMGSITARRHRAELYTIGLFMYRGAAAQPDRSVYPIARSRSSTLESILHQAPWRYAFVDFSRVNREAGSEWIWRPIVGLAWGTTVERFVPRDEYDGVLFIDTVHPPHYR